MATSSRDRSVPRAAFHSSLCAAEVLLEAHGYPQTPPGMATVYGAGGIGGPAMGVSAVADFDPESTLHRRAAGKEDLMTGDEAKGRVKKAAGELTGNKDLKREGDVDKASGKVKKATDKVADKARDAVRKK